MAKEYTCTTCGVVSTTKKHLCQPQEQTEKEHCGSTPTQSTNMCDTVNETAKFACSSCGRTTVDPELVCKPEKR